MFAIYGMRKSVFILVLLAGLLNPLTQTVRLSPHRNFPPLSLSTVSYGSRNRDCGEHETCWQRFQVSYWEKQLHAPVHANTGSKFCLVAIQVRKSILPHRFKLTNAPSCRCQVQFRYSDGEPDSV